MYINSYTYKTTLRVIRRLGVGGGCVAADPRLINHHHSISRATGSGGPLAALPASGWALTESAFSAHIGIAELGTAVG